MILVENISYVYGGTSPVQALSDISMKIPDGSINAIIGHTGSGKSTLVKLFNGLLRPTGGKIYIDSRDITKKNTDMKALRRRVGLVFQYPEHQLFEETAERDIAYGPRNLGLDENEIKRRVAEAAELLEIPRDVLQASPFELSGGQKRKTAIAGVIAMHPSVLILDEPTAGLDPRGRRNILKIIQNLHKERQNMIIIFVSHSMEDVAEYAENIFVMSGGELRMSGTPGEVFSHSEELQKIGLGVPQITRLAMKLKESIPKIPGDIYTVSRAKNIIEDILKNA